MKRWLVVAMVLFLGAAYAYAWDRSAAVRAAIEQERARQAALAAMIQQQGIILQQMQQAEAARLRAATPTQAEIDAARQRAAQAEAEADQARRVLAAQKAKGQFFKQTYHGPKDKRPKDMPEIRY